MTTANLGVERLAVVIPVREMAAGLAMWEELLGVSPTFVDGKRWAQFDTPSGRLCLAGTDRPTKHISVMLKVATDRLGDARTMLADRNFVVDEIHEGPHESRFTAQDPSGTEIVLYAPKR